MDYIAGQPVTISVVCTDEATGQNYDPTAITLGLQCGSSAPIYLTGGQLVHDGLGLFHYDLDTTGAPGYYTYQWQATLGLLGISEPGQFTVVAPSITGL